MNKIHFAILMAFTTMLAVGHAWGGSLDAPAAPNSSGSALYTTSDIYNRLLSGAAGAKRTGSFTEPSAGPAPTGYTTDQLLAVAPAADNINGAILSYVLVSKTFWGLRTDGTWGTKTGTRPPAPVPKTGQTTCYDPDGYNNPPASCNSSIATMSEDGFLMRGVPVIGSRFTNNGNGTVTDNLSGLIWLRNAMCTETVGSIGNPNGALNWSDALKWTHSLASGNCGLSDGSKANDWRLPNVKELQSLIDFGQDTADGAYALPAGHPFQFLSTFYSNPQGYWASTADFNNITFVWEVDIASGQTGSDPYTINHYIWPVKGGLSQ
jgi:hypothetical protein